MVRERRLELPRRLTHAPQTCLSTSSSTLAYFTGLRHPHLRKPYNLSGTFRVHRILYVFGYGLSRNILIRNSMDISIPAHPAQCAEKQREQNDHRNDQSICPPFHKQQIPHVQIGVIGEKRSKQSQNGTWSTLRNYECKTERKHICGEKVSVMHPFSAPQDA